MVGGWSGTVDASWYILSINLQRLLRDLRRLNAVTAVSVQATLLQPTTMQTDTHTYFTHYFKNRYVTDHTLRSAHGRKPRGGDEPPRIWSGGDAHTNCPPRFCHVSNFEAPDCVHYNSVKNLSIPWLWYSIHYFLKVHLQRLPNQHFRRKI